MRVTSKGQVTIPIDIRERLGLHAGTVVESELDDDGVRLRKARHQNSRSRTPVARMRGTATGKLSTDEIMALTRA